MLYVDTSVLVAAMVKESKSLAARRWLVDRAAGEMAISHWTVAEFSAALAVKQRVGEIDGDRRSALLAGFGRWTESVFEVVDVGRDDFREAVRLADRAETGLRAGDALHAAIALNRRYTLCTLDKGLAKAKTLGVETLLID